MLHFHSDKLIKTCPICQKAIKSINKAGKKLDKLGKWNFPKKFKTGIDYQVWKANNI
jgi:hypothetical protein